MTAKADMRGIAGGIQSERLDLLPMTAAFLSASLAGDIAKAEKLLGRTLPPEWLHDEGLMRIRLGQLRFKPMLQPWLLRAVILRATGGMIGHIGFHTAPGAAYLQTIAPGGVEMGYTIFPAFRRQGYATEAVAALMRWAMQEQNVQRFVLSISPGNNPSLRIANHFGFRKVGSHMDEEAGLEDIFVLERNETAQA
ncbi:MAG: GNAT family N-acetyltransferase [Caldilineaceae bacterium]|nr:GNAT family N-acetyltransferase [Caldilineaceae bacterium]